MTSTHLVPADIAELYEIHEWRNACAVLHSAFPTEWEELVAVLRAFRLRRSHIVTAGGGRSLVSQALDQPFYDRGWEERKFDTKIVVDDVERESPTHKVDCFKNGVGVEIEWNNKDPFYDRDLNNFRLLFELRVIDVGVIITRREELQALFAELGVHGKYGASTTHMSKLLPRLEGGSGGAEHGSVLADADLIASFSTEVWTSLGLGVRRELGDDEDRWRVSAGQFVGVARLGAQAGGPQVAIRPKLDADIFFLADYAFEAQRDLLADEQLRADLDSLRQEPAACLLAWFLAEVEAFARRWLRRDFILRREIFEGRIKGRLLMNEYAGGFIARAEAHRAPCHYFDLTQNNIANQILRAAVRYVSRVASLIPVLSARRAIQRRVSRVLPLLGGISDIKVHHADYNRLRLRGSLRHYQPMIAKCRAVLDGLHLTAAVGKRVEDAFLWDMNILFQEALRGILTQWDGGTLARTSASARIVDSAGYVERRSKVAPDFILSVGANTALLDAKYKNTRQHFHVDDESEFSVVRSRIRVSRADVYQAVSYGQHERFAPSSAGLVYPVALDEGEPLPKPYRVVGFSEDILILFIDIGAHARSNIIQFYDTLAGILTDSAVAED